MLIDLHSHTFMSDGELVPSELVRRAADRGHGAIALTDHADSSNLEEVVSGAVRAARTWNEEVRQAIRVVAGVEITHVPPELIAELISSARTLGAALVVVHGETIVEPVAPGTNRAAIEGGADILAHPGLITEDDVRLAAQHGVILEISARKGHCLGNGRVASLATRYGAKLVVNSDAHAPCDILTCDFRDAVARGAGLTEVQIEEAEEISWQLVEQCLAKR